MTTERPFIRTHGYDPRAGRHAFERHAYLSLADELSADPDFLDDADPQYIEAAREFALDFSLPFPPTADIDIALEEIRAAGAHGPMAVLA